MSAGDANRLPVASIAQMRSALLVLSRGHRWALVGTSSLFLVAAGLGLVFPITVGWIVETVSAGAGNDVPSAFWWLLGLLAGAVVLAGVLDFFGIVALARVVETMIATLRETFVERALYLPQATVERVGTGDIVARSSSDIRELSNSVPNVLPALASAVFTLTLAVVGMTVIDWRFAVAFLLVVPLHVLALRWYLRAAPPVYAAERTIESTRSQLVLETVDASPTVAAYRLGRQRRELTRGATWELVRWAVRARIVQNRLFGRINIAEAIGLLLILAVGFALATVDQVNLGQITAATLLFFRVIAPISTLLFVMDDLQSAAASFARVVGITGNEDLSAGDAHDDGAQDGVGRARGADKVVRTATPVVLLKDVTFEYRSGHIVIDDIRLSIEDGEHVALVGASGSGKTSLARLIAGTYPPSRGRVDRNLDRQRIAYLSQEHHVFAGTLRDNLVLARMHATDADLIDSLDVVGALHILRAAPDGLDTIVGRHGHAVSSSDAQHLALARVVLHDPQLAILDEATAEADTHDTFQLDRATARAINGRAAVVIAHRLGQAAACDRIIVLEAGRIVEEGDHEELLRRGQRYSTLWRAWSEGRGSDTTAP